MTIIDSLDVRTSIRYGEHETVKTDRAEEAQEDIHQEVEGRRDDLQAFETTDHSVFIRPCWLP